MLTCPACFRVNDPKITKPVLTSVTQSNRSRFVVTINWQCEHCYKNLHVPAYGDVMVLAAD